MPRTRGLAFAKVFEQLRATAGLSPADVARALDAPDSLVSRWRSGQSVPSLGYLERLAELFSVDRTTLEVLAGLRANNPASAQETISPEMAALADAERAELLTELSGIPPAFWEAILFTQRAGRKLAVDMAHKALEAAGHEPMISTPESGELAAPRRRRRRDAPRDNQPEGGPLASVFALYGAV